MVSRRNHLLDIVDTFGYYSALTFPSSVRGVIPSSSDAITCTEGNNSGLSQLLLYSVSNPIFCLLVFKVESHGFQEKSPSRYCRHIWVLLCFDLPVNIFMVGVLKE